MGFNSAFKGLNPTYHLLALLGAHPILHISRIRVKYLRLSFLLQDNERNSFGRHEKYKLYHKYSKPLTTSVGNHVEQGVTPFTNKAPS